MRQIAVLAALCALLTGCVVIYGASNAPIMIMLNTTATIPLQIP